MTSDVHKLRGVRQVLLLWASQCGHRRVRRAQRLPPGVASIHWQRRQWFQL